MQQSGFMIAVVRETGRVSKRKDGFQADFFVFLSGQW